MTDIPDGRPVVPGFAGDGIAWRLIARLPNARSRWGDIGLANPLVADPARGIEGVKHERRKGNDR
jgi:hypothetical protein